MKLSLKLAQVRKQKHDSAPTLPGSTGGPSSFSRRTSLAVHFGPRRSVRVFQRKAKDRMIFSKKRLGYSAVPRQRRK